MWGEGLLGSACLLVLPQGLPESPHPPSAWAPVGAAGEAGAEHLPIGRTPGSCPILFLLLVPVLWESRVEALGPISVCGGVLGDGAPSLSLGLDLAKGVQGDHRRLCQPSLPRLPNHSSESWLPWPLLIQLCPARGRGMSLQAPSSGP